MVYSGQINSDGSYTQANIAAQWHLVANPYPSYIDVVDLDYGQFLKSTWTKTSLGGGERGFSTYNILTGVGQNGGERYVAPGQSTWFRTYTAGDAITIPSSARVHASGELKNSAIEEDVIRLTLKSDYTKDEAVIVSREFGNEEITNYDSEKKIAGGKVANLYSLKNGSKAAINTLPTINQHRVVPLGYNVSSDGMSKFTLQVNNLDYFIPGASVYLVVKVAGIKINFREQQEYTFTPETTASDDRFELVFDLLTTDVQDLDISESGVNGSGINIFAVNQVAHIKFEDDMILTGSIISLYDMSGVLIQQVEVDSSEMEITLPKTNSIYIVKVIMGDVSYHQKVESL